VYTVHLWSVIEGIAIIAVCFARVVSFEITEPSCEIRSSVSMSVPKVATL